MSVDPALFAAYGALGLVVGFVAGLLGVGGGLIIVPVLIMLLHAHGLAAGMEPQLALGTSLASILFTSLSSVRAHHRHGAVEWPLVWRIAPGIVLGTLAGAVLAAQMSAYVLKVFFVVFLFYASVQMWLDFKPAPHRGLPGRIGTTLAGGVIGAVSSWVGIGGGTLSVPFMLWHNVPLHRAIATSAAIGFPIALAGAAGYVLGGWQRGWPAGRQPGLRLPAGACRHRAGQRADCAAGCTHRTSPASPSVEAGFCTAPVYAGAAHGVDVLVTICPGARMLRSGTESPTTYSVSPPVTISCLSGRSAHVSLSTHAENSPHDRSTTLVEMYMAHLQAIRTSWQPQQNNYSQLATYFDEKSQIAWGYMQGEPRPCFTPTLLREMLAWWGSMVSMIDDPAQTDVKYFVLASNVPDIYNLGGDLNLFMKHIAARDRDALYRYAISCIDSSYAVHRHLNRPNVTSIALVQGQALGGGLGMRAWQPMC